MNPDPTKFDEPALKAAVRRAWGDEKAPPSLRQKVEGLVGQAPDAVRVQRSFWRGHSRLALLSAAAVLLIGVGILLRQITSESGSSATGRGVAVAAALPTELGDQLVARHDICTKAAPLDHHFFTAAPKNNYKLISERMAAELHHPVAAKSLGTEWDFRGASLCPVGGTKSAHLIYASGDAFISVFSLPSVCFGDSCCGGDQEILDVAIKNHPISGFVQDGAFYAVVASTGGKTPVSIDEVHALRDRLKQNVIARGNSGELLHVIAAAP